MTALLALFLEREFGATPQDMGYVFALAGGATVVVRGVLLGKLVRRFGEKTVVRLGALALAGSMVGMAWIPTFLWVGLMVPLWAFGAGTMFPALASLVSLATDAHSQGSVLGGSQVVGGLGRVAGPLWGGLLFQSISTESPLLLGAALVAVAWVLAARIPVRAARARPVAATAGG
jgi:MFS family permease